MKTKLLLTASIITTLFSVLAIKPSIHSPTLSFLAAGASVAIKSYPELSNNLEKLAALTNGPAQNYRQAAIKTRNKVGRNIALCFLGGGMVGIGLGLIIPRADQRTEFIFSKSAISATLAYGRLLLEGPAMELNTSYRTHLYNGAVFIGLPLCMTYCWTRFIQFIIH